MSTFESAAITLRVVRMPEDIPPAPDDSKYLIVLKEPDGHALAFPNKNWDSMCEAVEYELTKLIAADAAGEKRVNESQLITNVGEPRPN